MKDGLGPDRFDCSGLAICAIAESLGKSALNWMPTLRHVREIWNEGSPLIGKAVALNEVVIGDLLIVELGRQIDGVKRRVPAHLSIVSNASSQDELILIHGLAKLGTVVERPWSPKSKVLGAVRLSEEKCTNAFG